MNEDTISKIGKIHQTVEQRDAVHFAVAPVTASENMYPGNWLKFAAKGIVDPFLVGPVRRGDSFFMFLKPGTITSLQHHWTHPAFDEDRKAIAEFWLREFAEKYGMDYNTIINTIKRGSVAFNFGEDMEIPYDTTDEEFLKHASIVARRELTGEPTFRCAC